MIKLEHNIKTGKVIEVELSSAEIAAKEARAAEIVVYLEKEAAQIAKKAALLAKLGITADEAALLLS